MDNLKDLETMQVIVEEFRMISKTNRQIILNMLSKEHEVLGDRVDDPYYQIKFEYQEAGGRGNAAGLIPYIKRVRDASGRDAAGNIKLGLLAAKDLVESW